MRPPFQKQRVLKLASRIILHKHGYNIPHLALGFIPVIFSLLKKINLYIKAMTICKQTFISGPLIGEHDGI